MNGWNKVQVIENDIFVDKRSHMIPCKTNKQTNHFPNLYSSVLLYHFSDGEEIPLSQILLVWKQHGILS